VSGNQPAPEPTDGGFHRRGALSRSLSDYHINIFWSEEDGGYIADIPDLVSCSAFGGRGEALTEVQHAKTAWLAAARAEGRPIPSPCYRPAIYRTT